MGNVHLRGIIGVQNEIALAAKRVIATVEAVVDKLEAPANACVISAWVVTAIAHVPRGAKPDYADGYNERDNGFYRSWDAILRSREKFSAWMNQHIMSEYFKAKYGEPML